MSIRIELTQGTIETLLIDIEDRLENLGNLETAGAVFTVRDKNNDDKMTDVLVTVDPAFPLRAQCVVDTTFGGVWETGKYVVYISFQNNPDTPVIRAGDFVVIP